MSLDKENNWEFPISIPRNPVKKTLKNLTGKFAQIINPSIRKRLLSGKSPANKIERAVLSSIFIELKATNQLEKLAELHKQIWASSDTQGYYDLTSNRLRGMFEQLKEPLYTTISDLTKEKNYRELIELGCGEGIIVNELSQKFKDIKSFVGMDINKAQIEINKVTYNSNKKLRFFSGDLSEDINLIKGSNKIFLSFGGVLEYLTEKELLIFLQELSSLQNITFIIYEPIEPGFNFKQEKHSILYGSEFSFSHPYYYYLSKCGFKVVSERLVESDDTNWVYLVSQTS